MMKAKEKVADLPIQTKLVMVYCLTTILILIVNLFMYRNINNMLQRLDQIYASNINLNKLSASLEQVQTGLINYLNTKTTDAMDGYYKAYQDYSEQIERFSDQVTGNESQRMERNIKEMSAQYLELTNLAVEAKRGRNVEKYRTYSEEAETIYGYITTYISSLNNEQFKSNSANYSVLSVTLRYVEIVNTVVFVIVAFSNVLLVIMVVGNITKPLKNLSAVADQVAGGNFDVDLMKVNSRDEVGVVTNAFNQMIISIRNYIERLKNSMDNERVLKERELKMETHLKDAQLKYLQAQINPHFLFNTLNAGAQLAMMEGADRTYEYIQNVADFFRYNIKKDHDTVPLREELELIDNYIYILNVRFSGEIHYEKDVDSSLENQAIPAMILQPIVENSVNYGIRDISWEGKIQLAVYREGDSAYIRIRDNGIGMEQEKIDQIMTSKLKQADLKGDSNGIGLDNVIGRLKLFYDRDDVFAISSPGHNKGTRVLIRIPLKEKKEDSHV